MSGTKEGGVTLRNTMINQKLAKHPGISREEAYDMWRSDMRKRASEAGKKGTTGGFYANRELARIAGAKGGRNSKRRKIVHE